MRKSLPEVQVVVAMAELRSSHTGLEEEVAAAAAAGVVTCLHIPQAHLQAVKKKWVHIQQDYYTDLQRGIL